MKGVGGCKMANLGWRNYWMSPCVSDIKSGLQQKTVSSVSDHGKLKGSYPEILGYDYLKELRKILVRYWLANP